MSSSPVETIMSDYPFKFISGSVTRVFWDVVDFPFPDGLDPDLIYLNMKLILEMLGCRGELSIMAYVDKEDDELVEAYKEAGITLIPQRAGDRSMLPDIAWWEVEMRNTVFESKSTTSLMVISKSIKKESVFFSFLEVLSRTRYNVLVAMPQGSPPTKLQTVRFDWLLTSLLDGAKPFDRQTATLQDHRRMRRELIRRETSIYYPRESTDSLVESMPDSPVESYEPICVFWDIMEFPFALCYEPFWIYDRIKSDLWRVGCRGELSIMAYADTEIFGDERLGLVHAYKKAGITIITQPADKYARAHSMSLDIVLWALENPATYFEPRRLLVVSENVEEGSDFFNALEALKDRYYDVVLLLPHELFSIVTQIHVFWDVQGCSTDVSSIGPALRKRGYRGKVSIRPYVDMDYGDDDSLDDCCVSSIRVVTKGDKYAKVTRMLLDILFWAMNYDDLPQNLMLLAEHSKDNQCDIVMQALERRGFNVIFRPSDSIDSSFESLCKSISNGTKLLNQTLEYQGRKITAECEELAAEPVVIFWLVENCPTNPSELWNKFRSTLSEKGYDQFVSMTAYIDKGKISEDLIHAYKKAGVSVRLVPEEDEFGKITWMTLDLINWTLWSGSPLNYMVISKPFTDAMCNSVLEPLRSRGFNVLFELPDYMVTFGSSVWSAKSLLST